MSEPTATILNMQRMSTEDGPGLRTTVFFKGCSLACDWCQNPESIDIRPEMTLHPTRCMGCGCCMDVCRSEALFVSGAGGMTRDAAACRACGSCARECPTGAQERLGEKFTLSSLIADTEKDRAYFGHEGGGVTASGGEPMVQAEFVASFFSACQDLGLHTALDTCGQCATGSLERVLQYADLVLYDLKLASSERHAELTGSSNERIVRNLLTVRSALEGGGGPSALWIRTPLIPGATATTENVAAIGRLLSAELCGMIDRWEICAFNELCAEKYERAGRAWSYEGVKAPSTETLERLIGAARSSGVDPNIVRLTGGMER